MAHHRQECLDSTKAWIKEKEEFQRLHPHYCETCGGWGWKYVKVWDMGSDDPCPDCLAKMICPLCGEKLDEEEFGDDHVCTDPDCGWRESGNQDGIPDPPECRCHWPTRKVNDNLPF